MSTEANKAFVRSYLEELSGKEKPRALQDEWTRGESSTQTHGGSASTICILFPDLPTTWFNELLLETKKPLVPKGARGLLTRFHPDSANASATCTTHVSSHSAVNGAIRSAIVVCPSSRWIKRSGTHSRGVFVPWGCGGLSTGDPVLCHPRPMLLVPFNAFSIVIRLLMGGIGLEPTTSSMSTMRSSQLS